ncbi:MULTISPECIES: hypothetical protein [Streptomyces]|mgnify:CR=1 FL=1|uniref:Secreted protein n=1 Tax=Streptomyces thermogriseus TaxID=75292 RepID=A0ABP4DC04_9ACTN|nr:MULTISPECIES: hypothetical protein [Streptomyces]MDN5381001.1 hypothetical protein [Streptomyces sp. LB8]
MHRGLVHVLAWSLATGAATTLSWWGVHTVMAGTAYDPPRALPITAAGAATQESRPQASSTHRPPASASPSPTPSRTSRTRPAASGSSAPASPATTPASSPSASPAPAAPSAPASPGQVKSYDTRGGRVVLSLGEASATLVSATPGTGWSMQVWKTETWIRVEFTSDTDRVSVICAWHDGPPHVDIGTY